MIFAILCSLAEPNIILVTQTMKNKMVGFSLNMIILFKKSLLNNDKYVFAKVIPEFQAFCQRIKDMFLRFTFMVTVMLMMEVVMMNGQNHWDIRNDNTHF